MDYKIDIYPGFNIFYYGFYLKGILSLFEICNVRYTTEGFPKFPPYGFAFVYRPKNLKIYIDAEDWDQYNHEALSWCDIYGKVNINSGTIPYKYSEKITPIAPSFGINIWNYYNTVLQGLHTYFLTKKGSVNNFRDHINSYWRQLMLRLPLSEYQPELSDPNYIFYVSSIWAPEDECNKHRTIFFNTVMNIKEISFEGGFAPPTRHDVKGLEQYTIDKKYKISEYLLKLKRSAIAFNTPAVWNCHGWKLGEFLALGKAIISRPLLRQIPEPLMHGKHIHFVNGSSDSIKEAIYIICKDDNYRKHLERNARDYFVQNIQPKCTINRLLTITEKR